MPTFTQLPSGNWRVQVRSGGTYRAATFEKKKDAQAWSREIEGQAKLLAINGFAPPPKSATLADLIDKYLELYAKEPGKTKAATLKMIKGDVLGKTRLVALTALSFRDFVDRRLKSDTSPGGVTLAADLSFVSAVLKWGRHARRLDLPVHLCSDARRDLSYRGLNTRSDERDREPTDAELAKLYAHWAANKRMKIPMETICRFALATAMREGEICNGIQVKDVRPVARTVVIRDRKDPREKKGNDQTVPLLEDAWGIISPILDERGDGAVFPYNAKSVSTAFTRAVQDLEIDDLHFHDLRHRATADLFRQGLDIPRVALMTGHKTWAQLKRYTKIKPSDVHDRLAERRAGNVVPISEAKRA